MGRLVTVTYTLPGDRVVDLDEAQAAYGEVVRLAFTVAGEQYVLEGPLRDVQLTLVAGVAPGPPLRQVQATIEIEAPPLPSGLPEWLQVLYTSEVTT